mgnify:CR=1 FL=1
MVPLDKVKDIISKHDALEKELSSGETEAADRLRELIAEADQPLRPFLIPPFGEPLTID